MSEFWSRSLLWLYVLLAWAIAGTANYKADGLAKRIGQLEVQVQRLEQGR